jgi:mannosyltransferase
VRGPAPQTSSPGSAKALSAVEPGGGRLATDPQGARPTAGKRIAPAWWPLIALTLLAAPLRLATLGSQSLWYDEAFTPVHVLRAGLGATLHNVAHTENTPPLWYLLEWAVTRVLGEGAVALRLLSALAGIATVPVAWAIGRELQGPPTRRAAFVGAAFVATGPLFVWYSQEARAYGLFVLLVSLAFLCFLRALAEPTRRRMGAFALAAALALLTHYFAVFLLAPMVVWLLWRYRMRAWVAVAPPILAGVALIPLIVAQGGHGTQWIGEWELASRLEAIPQYYLTGYSGSTLGHGLELLMGMVALMGVVYGLWRALTPREERGALIALTVAVCGVGIPIVLAVGGADYLAPRNLVGAMVAVSVLLAVAIAARRTGWVGMALGGLLAVGFLALTIDMAVSPRLQRGDWKGVAKVLGARAAGRAIVTVELGAAPLEYYLSPLHNLPRGRSVQVSEVDEVGYAPLRTSAGTPPAPGFQLSERRNIHGLWVYRFTSSGPVRISESRLREQTITSAPHPEVLAPSPSGKTA